MISDDQNQQQPIPTAVYPPRAPDPLAHQGQPAPMTDKMQSVPTPSGLLAQPWPQPSRTPQASQFLPQADQTPQPGMPWPQPSTVAPRRPKRKRSNMRGVAIFALTCLLAIVFAIGLFSGWTFAHTSSNTGGPTTPTAATTSTSSNSGSLSTLEAAQEQAIARVTPAVVEIQGTLAQAVSIGSGVIIDPQGDIVTNNHVVSGASSLTVTFSNGKSQTAQLIGTDPAHDLAVLRVQPFSGMTVATLGDSAQLTVGQEVLAIGNPLGYSESATSGVVSALNRSEAESRDVTLNNLIQTSAPINPGNSGGALINLQGQVIGIPTLSAVNNETNTPANGIGFAIPSNTVQSVVAQILGSSK